MLRLTALFGCLLATGCAALPEVVHQPTLHNPFPQISRVGVATFFNASKEPTLDGSKVAEAYAAELAEVPGYEVVSVAQVDSAIRALGLRMDTEADARRLAQALDIDAVVIGTATEFTPYYPPRLTLKVAWYAANPNFHPIPAGYGLPWGTSDEKHIPGPLVFQAELALAKEQLKTQTPPYRKTPLDPPAQGDPVGTAPSAPGQTLRGTSTGSAGVKSISHEGGSSGGGSESGDASETLTTGETISDVPSSWPDPRGFVPKPPVARPAPGVPSDAPVMQHIKSFRGNDVEFTTALEDYYYSRDDARMGGWQNYLRRSDDFIRFCCRMHIWEMLSARGGAGETRVVWRWSPIR